jgi:hypothetical protein
MLIVLTMLFLNSGAQGQERFLEGTIVYKVSLTTTDNTTYTGQYTLTFKGGNIRKELKLNNGYNIIVLVNTNKNTVISLESAAGKKYAVQTDYSKMLSGQDKFKGFNLKQEGNGGKTVAGLKANRGVVTYKDGSQMDMYYTSAYKPDKGITYDRFPDAEFIPLLYTYTDEKGYKMKFEADAVNLSPVENSLFQIPGDYKLVSRSELKQ